MKKIIVLPVLAYSVLGINSAIANAIDPKAFSEVVPQYQSKINAASFANELKQANNSITPEMVIDACRANTYGSNPCDVCYEFTKAVITKSNELVESSGTSTATQPTPPTAEQVAETKPNDAEVKPGEGKGFTTKESCERSMSKHTPIGTNWIECKQNPSTQKWDWVYKVQEDRACECPEAFKQGHATSCKYKDISQGKGTDDILIDFACVAATCEYGYHVSSSSPWGCVQDEDVANTMSTSNNAGNEMVSREEQECLASLQELVKKDRGGIEKARLSAKYMKTMYKSKYDETNKKCIGMWHDPDNEAGVIVQAEWQEWQWAEGHRQWYMLRNDPDAVWNEYLQTGEVLSGKPNADTYKYQCHFNGGVYVRKASDANNEYQLQCVFQTEYDMDQKCKALMGNKASWRHAKSDVGNKRSIYYCSLTPDNWRRTKMDFTSKKLSYEMGDRSGTAPVEPKLDVEFMAVCCSINGENVSCKEGRRFKESLGVYGLVHVSKASFDDCN